MNKLMTSSQFVSKVKDIQENHKTVYMLGTIGQKCTDSLINSCAKRLPGFYTTSKKTQLKAYVGNAYAFDCVGLIKAVLWGWAAGNAPYAVNGVPDIDETNMINNYCTNVSTDFKGIMPGEVVWLPGHIEVYVGDNLVIECTPKWTNNVQYSGLGNLGGRSGYNTRSWTKRGKLLWLDYGTGTPSEEPEKQPTEPSVSSKLKEDGLWGPDTTKRSQKFLCTTVDGIVSNQPSTNKYCLPNAQVTSWKFMSNGYSGGSLMVNALQKMLANKNYYTDVVDGYCGEKTVTALQRFLAAEKIYTDKIDGCMGPNTVKAWQKYLNKQ